MAHSLNGILEKYVEDAREQMKTAEEVVNMVEKYLKET